MSPIFKKLNLKSQTEIVVINAPASFEAELATLDAMKIVRDPKTIEAIKAIEAIHFCLAFTKTQSEVDSLSQLLCSKAKGDAVLWFAYPKGSSKRFKCEFNRDTGWDVLRASGFDTVRQVAIDEDWSALRFRRVEYINASGA